MQHQKLSRENKDALLKGLHLMIDRATSEMVSDVLAQEYDRLLFYPPGAKLNDAEREAMNQLMRIPAVQSALTKLLLNNSAAVVFGFLNWVDGTGDPDGQKDWTGIDLVDLTSDEDREMLHDAFLDSAAQNRA